MLLPTISSLITSTLFSTSLTLAKPSGRRLDSLVVFGDSNSDNGNAYRYTNNTWPSDPGYYKHRFSDGPTWPDYMPSLIGTRQVLNFAYASGTVNNSIVTGLGGQSFDIPMPSVTDQVATFLSSQIPIARDSIVVIFAGGNDIAFGGPNVDVGAVTASVINNVKLLAARGFASFVLSTRPANALQPANANADPATLASLNAYTSNWHGNLTQAIGTSRLPRNVSVKLWDWYGTVEWARNVAVKHGIDVDTPCLVGVFGEVPTRTLCEDPEKHLFFDTYHMSTVMHKAVARRIAQVIAN